LRGLGHPLQPNPSHPIRKAHPAPAQHGEVPSLRVSQHETTERNEYRRDRCSAVWLGICLLKAGTRRHSACEWPAWICPGSERTSLHLLAAFGGAVSRRVGFRIRGRWGLESWDGRHAAEGKNDHGCRPSVSGRRDRGLARADRSPALHRARFCCLFFRVRELLYQFFPSLGL
jgi:hypothetical protein